MGLTQVDGSTSPPPRCRERRCPGWPRGWSMRSGQGGATPGFHRWPSPASPGFHRVRLHGGPRWGLGPGSLVCCCNGHVVDGATRPAGCPPSARGGLTLSPLGRRLPAGRSRPHCRSSSSPLTQGPACTQIASSGTAALRPLARSRQPGEHTDCHSPRPSGSSRGSLRRSPAPLTAPLPKVGGLCASTLRPARSHNACLDIAAPAGAWPPTHTPAQSWACPSLPPSTTGASTPALHPGTDLRHRPGMRRARGPPHSASFHWIAPSENWLRAACLAHQPRASPRPVLLENEAHHLGVSAALRPRFRPMSLRHPPCAHSLITQRDARAPPPTPHGVHHPYPLPGTPKRLASHPRPPHTPLRQTHLRPSPLQHSALDGPPSRYALAIPSLRPERAPLGRSLAHPSPGARDWLGLDARPAAYAVLPAGSAPGCRHGFGWSTHLHHWRT